MTKKVSIRGLANIGTLLGRAAPPPEPKRGQIDSHNKRRNITVNAVDNVAGLFPQPPLDVAKKIHNFVEAAICKAYALGHADALLQSEAVDALLDKQYKARTKLTLPSAVAAIMEQSGMSSMLLDLEAVATVFDRTRIRYEVVRGDAGEFVRYDLSHIVDDKVTM